MKVLRVGNPIALLGICAYCQSIVEATTSEAIRVLNGARGNVSYRVDCPVCCGHAWLDGTAITVAGVTYRAGMQPLEPGPTMLSIPKALLVNLYAALTAALAAHDPRHWRETCQRSADTLSMILEVSST